MQVEFFGGAGLAVSIFQADLTLTREVPSGPEAPEIANNISYLWIFLMRRASLVRDFISEITLCRKCYWGRVVLKLRNISSSQIC